MDENISSQEPVIIDTDPGADDAASILWVLANKRFGVKALTVAGGNVDPQRGTDHALKVLEVCGRKDIPVYTGHGIPVRLIRDETGGERKRIDLFKRGSAAFEMTRIARESEEKVTILALAPLTNVACALLLDPDFKDHVGRVIFMGCRAGITENGMSASSFNRDADPEAAELVYGSGIPITEIGAEVCDKVRQSERYLQLIARANTRVADFLSELLDYPGSSKENSDLPHGRIRLHDLVCTAYLICPKWFKTRRPAGEELDCLFSDHTVGGERHIFCAYDVDGKAAMRQWVEDICSFDPAVSDQRETAEGSGVCSD